MTVLPANRGTRSRLVHEAAEGALEGWRVDFGAFFLRERQPVLRLAYALTGNRWIAEDLTQDAFLAAHREWERVGGYDDPGAWVRRVVVNLSVSAFRRRISEAKALARLAVAQPTTVPALSGESAEFWSAVRALPRRRAQVIALFYLEDRSVAEIAEILKIAPGTVKKSLHDGRAELARRLGLEEGRS
jgi:RNA polymerase sigma-70 factor (ECF subfamily)